MKMLIPILLLILIRCDAVIREDKPTPKLAPNNTFDANSQELFHHNAAKASPGCRDRFGTWDQATFYRRSCFFCFKYLFPTRHVELQLLLRDDMDPRSDFNPRSDSDPKSDSDPNSDSDPRDEVESDLLDSENKHRRNVSNGGVSNTRPMTSNDTGEFENFDPNRLRPLDFDSPEYFDNLMTLNDTRAFDAWERILTDEDRSKWQQCCEAAGSCCTAQLVGEGTGGEGSRDGCEMTWDGYSCWGRAAANSAVTQFCPEYMSHSLPTRKSVKQCTKNATWFEKEGQQWTDYTPCLDRLSYMYVVYTCLGFNVLSVMLLVPAILTFCLFRDLLRQLRVRLHIHFFVSLTLDSLVTSVWYMVVHYDLLTNPLQATRVINTNPVWCRLLATLKLYCTSSTYFWMLCEGCYLYRLLSCAFEQPESLRGVYVLGWGAPGIGVLLYACLRAAGLQNDSCWVKNAGAFEWIIYGPNLLCLLLNVVFLFNILRILLFQLHAHPQEPSTFRRGLKAGLMLIPLFGLHLLLAIYRPDSTGPSKHYEYVSLAISNSQGVFVSLIFCFFNDEVLSHCWRRCSCCRGSLACLRTDPRRSASQSTQWTLTEDKHSETMTSLRSRMEERAERREMERWSEEGTVTVRAEDELAYLNNVHTSTLD